MARKKATRGKAQADPEGKIYQKVRLHLPPEVFDAFAEISVDVQARNWYCLALREAGWTFQSIAEASGLTRERVRQIVTTTTPDPLGTIRVPERPYKNAPKAREIVEPEPEKLARLKALQPIAQAVRSHSMKGRAEAEEYTRLLAEVHLEDGVSLYRLAQRLEVSHGALRFRLARYGYLEPKNGGTSKVYTPVLAKNRLM